MDLFHALFGQPAAESDPHPSADPSAAGPDPEAPPAAEGQCHYEAGMRRAESRLLDLAGRYHGAEEEDPIRAAAVLEPFDTAIPRAVLPRSCRVRSAASAPPSRAASFRRMGSSLLGSCVAPDATDVEDDADLLPDNTGSLEESTTDSLAGSAQSSSVKSSSGGGGRRTVRTRPTDEVLHIHAVRASCPPPQPRPPQPQPQSQPQHSQQQPPERPPVLVLLHGYANGLGYFYRNLHGLASSGQFSEVYAVDLLGFGLSSRPPFPAAPDDADGGTGSSSSSTSSASKEEQERKRREGTKASKASRTKAKTQSVREAEDFFVESLEAWRAAQGDGSGGLESMVLGGHSLGGYVAVAYAERYPHRVGRLLLLSPVGVPGDADYSSDNNDNCNSSSATSREDGAGGTDDAANAPPPPPQPDVPLVTRVAKKMAQSLFDAGWTPGAVIRTLPASQGRRAVESYVAKRLPGVASSCPEERSALIDYLYHNAVLPPSGEECLNRLLLPGATAVHPLADRVPHLTGVSDVVFLYGEKDWMDPTAGMDVERHCRRRRAMGDLGVPDVSVRAVRESGHLLMIENWVGFNAAVVVACGGRLDPAKVARRHRPASFVDTHRRRRRKSPFHLATETGSETTEESESYGGSQEGVELDLRGKYIIEEEEDFIEYGKEATFTEKCTGVSIRKPTLGR